YVRLRRRRQDDDRWLVVLHRVRLLRIRGGLALYRDHGDLQRLGGRPGRWGDVRDWDGQLEVLALHRHDWGRGVGPVRRGRRFDGQGGGKWGRLLGRVGLGRGRVGGEHGQPADPDGQRAGQDFPA